MELKVFTTGLSGFRAWAGGKDLWDEICRGGLVDEFENFLLEMCADAHGFVDETMVNDVLWFEEELVREHLGINDADDSDEE